MEVKLFSGRNLLDECLGWGSGGGESRPMHLMRLMTETKYFSGQ